jgi:hypothetical protein
MEEEALFDILDFNLANGSHPSPEETDLVGNLSELYIFPPEKEGSPFADCASIVLKSDLKVSGLQRAILNFTPGPQG